MLFTVVFVVYYSKRDWLTQQVQPIVLITTPKNGTHNYQGKIKKSHLCRSQIQYNITMTLGNNNETECNVLSVSSGSAKTRRRRSLASNNTIKGKAAALEYDGIKYK